MKNALIELLLSLPGRGVFKKAILAAIIGASLVIWLLPDLSLDEMTGIVMFPMVAVYLTLRCFDIALYFMIKKVEVHRHDEKIEPPPKSRKLSIWELLSTAFVCIGILGIVASLLTTIFYFLARLFVGVEIVLTVVVIFAMLAVIGIILAFIKRDSNRKSPVALNQAFRVRDWIRSPLICTENFIRHNQKSRHPDYWDSAH